MTHRSICSVLVRSLALCRSLLLALARSCSLSLALARSGSLSFSLSLSPGDAIMGEHAKLSGGVFVSA